MRASRSLLAINCRFGALVHEAKCFPDSVFSLFLLGGQENSHSVILNGLITLSRRRHGDDRIWCRRCEVFKCDDTGLLRIWRESSRFSFSELRPRPTGFPCYLSLLIWIRYNSLSYNAIGSRRYGICVDVKVNIGNVILLEQNDA
jgi:hypothetical protein